MQRPLRVLRSVRLLRLLRLTLLTGLAAKGLRESRNIFRRRGLNWVLLIVLVLNLIAAAMVLEFKRGNPDANIDSYPDALWWAATTITTVGYGDRFPMSPAGRGVAVVLMIAGIAMSGVIKASIAAYFVPVGVWSGFKPIQPAAWTDTATSPTASIPRQRSTRCARTRQPPRSRGRCSVRQSPSSNNGPSSTSCEPPSS